MDLMAVLVVFLLLTAAWVQIEALSTNVDNVTASDGAASETPPEKKVVLMMTILKSEIRMTEDEKATPIAIELGPEGNLKTDRIKQVLQEWRTKYPDRKDIVLTTENEIPYRHMITAFDTLVGEGWPDVGVSTQ
jgi:biopolymer transport protein ExbD